MAKCKITFIGIIISTFAFGQNNLDSNSFQSKCNYSYNVDFKFPYNYSYFNHKRLFVPTYKTWSCMPYNYSEALINNDKVSHYVIYFHFDETASSNDDFKMVKKYFNSEFDPNTNYLGGKNCQIERERGLIKIYRNSDYIKFNADSILCIKVDSLSRERNDPELNEFIYVVIHKKNIGDIYVCFAYKEEYETEVKEEIENLWKIIKFKP